LRAAIGIDAARFINVLANSGPQAGASAGRTSGKLDAIAPDDADHDFDATDRAGLSFHESVLEIDAVYHLKFWVLSYSEGRWPQLDRRDLARLGGRLPQQAGDRDGSAAIAGVGNQFVTAATVIDRLPLDDEATLPVFAA